MELSFVHPEALLGLLLLPAFYIIYRWRAIHLSHWVRRLTLYGRLAVVSLIVLSVARPVLAQPLDNLDVVFALDSSQSVPLEQQQKARQWVQAAMAAMGPRDRAGVVSFGSGAQIDQPLSDSRALAGQSAAPGGFTDIEKALRAATSLFDRPAMKRVVVLSDGAQNVGHGEGEARQAAARGVEISSVPLAAALPSPEVLIQSLDSPPRVREGENFEVDVVVYSTVTTQATLRFWVDGRAVSQDTVSLEAGPNRFVYRQVGSKQGFHPYRARVDSTQDTWKENNELGAFTVVGEKARVLLIDGSKDSSNALLASLNAASMEVVKQPPKSIPSSLAGLTKYDAMVLYNVPATALSLDQQKTIQDYVRSLGRGLLVVGGKDSYSMGGYANTPLEETLPVNVTPPSKQEHPTISLVLVIDKSGSMDMTGRADTSTRVTKMSMAKEAAILATEALQTDDEIGVVSFDMATRWVFPIQALSDTGVRDGVRDAINGLRADGGTEIYPALQAAYDAIKVRDTKLKHIVLLTDGRAFSNPDYDRLVNRMQADGITLSTIAIGVDSDTRLLERIAKVGNGRYYFTDDPRNIPKILTQETMTAANTRIVDHTFNPKIMSASPAVRDFTAQDLPPLDGYVVTSIKPAAELVLGSHVDDPILAQWQYGLGRAVAWTSNLEQPWARDWLNWPELSRFWAQTLRAAMPSPLDGELQVTVSVEGGKANIVADAVGEDGSYGNLLESKASVISPGNNRQEILLRQTAPGRYEGQLDPREEGAYQIDVSQLDSGRTVRAQTFGFVMPYSPEFGVSSGGPALLEDMATQTGGKLLTEPQEAFKHDIYPTPRVGTEIWPWLLGIALVLLPAELALRRVWPERSTVRRWLAPLSGLRKTA